LTNVKTGMNLYDYTSKKVNPVPEKLKMILNP